MAAHRETIVNVLNEYHKHSVIFLSSNTFVSRGDKLLISTLMLYGLLWSRNTPDIEMMADYSLDHKTASISLNRLLVGAGTSQLLATLLRLPFGPLAPAYVEQSSLCSNLRA